MQQANLSSLSKHLSKMEKNLDRLQAFQAKGFAPDRSLSDVYIELRDVGAYLKTQSENNIELDKELEEITARYKNLLAKFDYISGKIKLQDQGIVMASNSTLPDFFYNITSRYPVMWRFFEKITTVFGIGMIGFTIISLTYFLAVGNIPVIAINNPVASGINGVVFMIGVILGLCVHEFAHGVVLANNGIEIKRVGTVAGSIVGGFVEADETTFFQAEPGVHLKFNASSIGNNAMLAMILGAIAILTSSQLFLFLALGNLFFGFINSFPISPLDGGWVYEDLIKLYVNDKKVKEILLSARFVIFILWIILFIRYVLL